MPAPTPPGTNPYGWASGPSTRIAPTAPQVVSGFVAGTPAGSKLMNGLIGNLMDWATASRLSLIYTQFWGVEHLEADGRHGAVDAASVDIRTGGYVGFQDAPVRRLPLGPVGAGWQGATTWDVTNNTPQTISPPGTASTTIYKAIEIPMDADSAVVTLGDLRFVYALSAGDTLAISVIAILRASPWTTVVVNGATANLTSTAGVLTGGSVNLGGALYDDDYDYYVRVVGDANASGANVQLGPIGLEYQQNKL